MATEILIPGDLITQENVKQSVGAYMSKNGLRAALVGELINNNINNSTICGITTTKTPAKNLSIAVGDIVFARVVRISSNQAFLEILSLGDGYRYPFQSKAVIRREEIRETEIDKIVINDYFRPGDIVRAKVVSQGDSKYYFLSTIGEEFGVVLPRVTPEEPCT